MIDYDGAQRQAEQGSFRPQLRQRDNSSGMEAAAGDGAVGAGSTAGFRALPMSQDFFW